MTLGNKLPGDCGDMDAFAQKADSRRWLGELDFSWAKQTWMHRFKQHAKRNGDVDLPANRSYTERVHIIIVDPNEFT